MDKSTEIKTLQSLKGDTYFAQFFSNKDIDQMCDNIKGDIAIESYCQFNEKNSCLEAALATQKKEYEKKMYDFGMELIYQDCDEDFVYGAVKERLGQDAIIKFKREKHMDLTEEEIDYLVSKL